MVHTWCRPISWMRRFAGWQGDAHALVAGALRLHRRRSERPVESDQREDPVLLVDLRHVTRAIPTEAREVLTIGEVLRPGGERDRPATDREGTVDADVEAKVVAGSKTVH